MTPFSSPGFQLKTASPSRSKPFLPSNQQPPHYLAIAVFIHEIEPSDRPILVTSNLATAL
jgi:hypothetical protein